MNFPVDEFKQKYYVKIVYELIRNEILLSCLRHHISLCSTNIFVTVSKCGMGVIKCHILYLDIEIFVVKKE